MGYQSTYTLRPCHRNQALNSMLGWHFQNQYILHYIEYGLFCLYNHVLLFLHDLLPIKKIHSDKYLFHPIANNIRLYNFFYTEQKKYRRYLNVVGEEEYCSLATLNFLDEKKLICGIFFTCKKQAKILK